MKKVFVVFLCLLAVCFSGCVQSSETNQPGIDANVDNNSVFEEISSSSPSQYDEIEESVIRVHFLDVGQGDSIFIEMPNKTMLIDAAESKYDEYITNYINNLGYQKIDYLVATHPHADHIGAMKYIVENFEIGSIYMPKAVTSSKTFENLLLAIKEKGLKIITAKPNEVILKEENICAEIIAPTKEYSSLNNMSAVVKLTNNHNTFLFMGDAEKKSENDITANVSCDVIKLGHHGSSSSSSYDFIKKTNAKIAVISCGEGNIYNHPHIETLETMDDLGIEVYRTDISGTIIIESNGNGIKVKK